MFIKFRRAVFHWFQEAAKYGVINDDDIKAPRWTGAANKIGLTKKEFVESDMFQTRGIHFKVYSGQGGVVIETRQYEPKADENRTALHVIPEGEDLATALAHIITLQYMR